MFGRAWWLRSVMASESLSDDVFGFHGELGPADDASPQDSLLAALLHTTMDNTLDLMMASSFITLQDYMYRMPPNHLYREIAFLVSTTHIALTSDTASSAQHDVYPLQMVVRTNQVVLSLYTCMAYSLMLENNWRTSITQGREKN